MSCTELIVRQFRTAMRDIEAGARQALSRHPDRVEVSELSDGGIRLVIKPDAKTTRNTLMVLGVTVVLAAVGFWVLTRCLGGSGMLESSPRRWAMALMMGVMALTLVIVAKVVQMVSRPQRETIVEARPGRLQIDRWVMGDHVVRDYAAQEIRRIYANAGLNVETRADAFILGQSSVPEPLVAAAELVGGAIWGEAAAILYNVDLPDVPDGRARVLVFDQTAA